MARCISKDCRLRGYVCSVDKKIRLRQYVSQFMGSEAVGIEQSILLQESTIKWVKLVMNSNVKMNI